MKPFDYYTQSVNKHHFYLYIEEDKSVIIQITSNPKSWDDISEDFKYSTFKGGTSRYGNSRLITHAFSELCIDDIKQNYPELFI